MFRACFTDDQQGKSAARVRHREARQEEGRHPLRGAGLLLVGPRGRRSATSRKKLGAQIVADKGYQKGETNFTTYLNEIKAPNPEIIFVPELLQRHGSHRAAGQGGGHPRHDVPRRRRLGLRGPARRAPAPSSRAPTSRTTTRPTCPWPNSQNVRQELPRRSTTASRRASRRRATTPRACSSTRWRARPGSRPTPSRTPSPQTKGFQGATGTINIDANRNAQKPIVIVQIKGRKFTYSSTRRGRLGDRADAGGALGGASSRGSPRGR